MKKIYLAKKYDLVVGDRFELFYRSVIRAINPYNYYIFVRCNKGRSFPRYYTFTPKEDEVGSFTLHLSLIDEEGKVVEEDETTLVVHPIPKHIRKLNILCLGDSLTVNGVWPSEAERRLNGKDGMPSGLNLGLPLNFVGSFSKGDVRYEGYGGWKWKEFCDNSAVGLNSSVWIEADHHLDQSDQESIWETKGKEWILETIEEGQLKFKRGSGNIGMSPEIGDYFKNVRFATHKEDIKVKSFKYCESNPLWFDNDISFKKYALKQGVETLDLVFVLLTWNGQYIPYCEDFSHHEPYIVKFLNTLHNDFPKAKVYIMGIQLPSLNGGITYSYGCQGPYSDLLGEIVTVMNYSKYLEDLSLRDEYASFVHFIDLKAQFDSEYNMPCFETPVNARSKILERTGNNGVHPTMDGYLQIGDCFYRSLCGALEGEEDEKVN